MSITKKDLKKVKERFWPCRIARVVRIGCSFCGSQFYDEYLVKNGKGSPYRCPVCGHSQFLSIEGAEYEE